MIVRTKDLIKSEQFIREPVEKIGNEVLENTSKRIILNSGKGSGKTTILTYLEDRCLSSENPFILTRFDSIITLAKCPTELYDAKMFEHYYELVFAFKLLSYIERNYNRIYEDNFSDMNKFLEDIKKATMHYINNRSFEIGDLGRYLSKFEMTGEIVKTLRSNANIETLNLMIDRFDHTNGSSGYVQNLLSDYFDLFDKVLVTTDDKALDDETLKNKGYDFINKNYGTDRNIVKQIMKARINDFNLVACNDDICFKESFISDKIYDNLIEKTDGNILLMLDSLRASINLFKWHDGDTDKMEEFFNKAIDENLDYAKKLEKVNANPSRLYL